MFAYIVTTGRNIVISCVQARALAFFARTSHNSSPKKRFATPFEDPQTHKTFPEIPQRDPYQVLRCQRGDQREPQLQFLAAERNLGWILGAKRAPKVIPNHPKSQKIGAKNKNVVMHGRQWKKYRDFVF